MPKNLLMSKMARYYRPRYDLPTNATNLELFLTTADIISGVSAPLSLVHNLVLQMTSFRLLVTENARFMKRNPKKKSSPGRIGKGKSKVRPKALAALVSFNFIHSGILSQDWSSFNTAI
jgi:hypothetical protein